jgi:predicted Ser/Thr protein kinase
MRTKIGKFEILRLLGKGSMGEVYLGLDPSLGREVAIKTINRDSVFGAESESQFDREAKALAAMNHPNIVTLFDYGTDDGTSYLVMEYLEGDDLATLIERQSLSRRELLEALAQVCDGLAYAHDRGFVHRDLKPGNVRVTLLGNRIHAKLLDFGIAAAACADPTALGSWVGTVSYMAPEYLGSGKATPSSDLFAIGVAIYEILSGGRKPFTADTPAGVINAILRLPPIELDPEEVGDVPGGFGEILARSLAKEPADRYPSAAALASAIRSGLSAPSPGKAPVEAAPIPAKQIVVGRGPRANCLSLRVALRQAPPSATILVLPGVYKESLVVDRSVTIQGEGDAEGILIPEGITIEGGSLGLVNVTVGNSWGVALRVLPGAQVRARDVCFQEAPAGGVELGPGTTGDFLRCRFNGNGAAGLLAMEGSRSTLEDCELAGNQLAGLHAFGGATVRFRACRIVANEGIGISAVDAADVVLVECELGRNQGPGMLLDRGAAGRLGQCFVTGGRSLGVQCRQGATLSLEGCLVEGNALGGLLLDHGNLAQALGPDNRILDGVLHY